MIRLVDYDVKPGTSSNMGKGDAWPAILKKIKACDICSIVTPIGMGVPAGKVVIFEVAPFETVKLAPAIRVTSVRGAELPAGAVALAVLMYALPVPMILPAAIIVIASDATTPPL